MRFFKRARLHGRICKFFNDLRDHRIATREEAYSRLFALLDEAEELDDSSFTVIQGLIEMI